jgi:hypothetical protein
MADQLTFPSAEWFEALAQITKEDPNYRKFGRLNAVVAFKCGEKNVELTFDVLNIRDVREITDDQLRDVDFVVEMPPEIWREMLVNIQENGKAGLDWTLNTLDLKYDEPIHKNLMEDGYNADKFFMYNPSLQVFIDNAAKIETRFAPELAEV